MHDEIFSAFDAVHADETVKAKTAAFLRQAGAVRQPKAGAARLAAACAALVLVLGLGAYRLLLTPVSYVSIDVNPSIELGLNRLDRIVSAQAYNEDGRLVLSQLDVRGKYYTEGIEVLLESEAMAPYLLSTSALTVTVASPSEESDSRLLSGVRSCAGYQNHGGLCSSAELDSLPAAHANGFSFGKYAVYQALASYDSSLTMEDCRRMTIAELCSHLESCEAECRREHTRSGRHWK